jgi:hypothetical protein
MFIRDTQCSGFNLLMLAVVPPRRGGLEARRHAVALVH